jgi:hypothetical protein
MKKRIVAILLGVALSGSWAMAQEPEKAVRFSGQSAEQPPKFYRLVYTLSEMEGAKTLTKRTYSMTILSWPQRIGSGLSEQQLRAGTRVPVQTEGGKFQYMDVGVNIDCHGVETVKGLELHVRSEISSLPSDFASASPSGTAPPVRQLRNDSTLLAPMDKTTQVYSADEPTSSRRFELTVAATEMK